jgi:hypothetical protein
LETLSSPHLTKSRYIAGLQCPRRLWLLANEPQDYNEPDRGSVLDFGRIIGEKARLLFPSGVLVDEAPWQHEQAVARTAALMADPEVPAIFEAAFTLGNVRIRADILERCPGGWRLLEVKSSTAVKDHHLDDVALQAFVLAGSAVPVESQHLVYVNKTYVRGTGEVDWKAYFARVDVGEAVAARAPGLSGQLASMGTVLLQLALPNAEPGKQCGSPVDCDFWDRCTADKPADWIAKLPHISQKQAQALAALGVESIAHIPDKFQMSQRQSVIRDTVISGQPFIAPDLPRLLHRFGPPACYLDFEAMAPPIPLYEGTRHTRRCHFNGLCTLMMTAGRCAIWSSSRTANPTRDGSLRKACSRPLPRTIIQSWFILRMNSPA